MDQMVTADSGAVAITGQDDHMELWIGKFDAGCEGDCASVCRVDGVKVQIPGGAGGTADAGDNDEVLTVKVQFGILNQFLNSHGHVPHNHAIAATRTPHLRKMIDPHIQMNKITRHDGFPPFHSISQEYPAER